ALLGAQRFDPVLATVADELGIHGPIATITAGWQERESEDTELNEHLRGRTTNLRLHARAEEVFKKDPELHAAHRKKQEILRHNQDSYRIRLEHELDANHVISRRQAPETILDEEERASIGAIRLLDDYHIGQTAKVEAEFEEAWKPLERPQMQK